MDTNSETLSTYFRGFAKIDLHHLSSENFSERNVKRYLKIFQIEQYSREDPLHTIAVSIREDTLSKALSRGNIDASSLYDPRNLPYISIESEELLECLQGQDLLEAAKRSPGLRWWTVRLYVAEIPQSLKLYLRDTYSATCPSKDYELLQSLWFQDILDFEELEAKLGTTNSSYVQRAYKNPGLHKALSALFPYTALWDSFTLRQLGYVVSSHSYEEMTHYLREIYNIWSILPSNKVDSRSVKMIEGMMPSYSLEDQQKITSWMSEGTLFPDVDDENRDKIQAGFLAIEGRILSLRLFFLDASCLQGTSLFLRQHLGLGRKRTLRQTFLRCWKPSSVEGKLTLQVSEHEFEEISTMEASSEEKAYKNAAIFSMLQVWMACFRYFIEPRRGKGTEEPSVKPILDLEGRPMMLKTAERLGFNLTKQAKSEDPRIPIPVFRFVSKTLLSDAESVDARKTKFLAGKFRLFYPLSASSTIPSFTTDSEALKASFRAGRPETQEYSSIRPVFFMRNIYSSSQPAKLYPTAFAVMREIFFSFFGRHYQNETEEISSTPYQNEAEEISSSPVQLDPHPLGTPPISSSSEPREEYTHDIERVDDHYKIPDSHSNLETRSGGPSVPFDPASAMRGIELTAPLAAGFEDEISIGPLNKRCEITVHRSATEILNTWFQKGNHELIVFFLFDSRAYYKFLVTAELDLRLTINSLSNDHYFLIIDKNSARTADRGDLLDEAKTRRLILVGLNDGAKVLAEEPNISDNGRISLLDLEEYLKKYDVVTGKRRAIEDDNDSSIPSSKKRQR